MLLRLSRLVARLPLGLLHATGALAGRLVLALAPAYRRKLEDNLRTAGLHDPARVLTAAGQAGRAAFEAPFVWFRPGAELARLAPVDGLDEVRRLLDGGRGLIFLTPHLGCFEIVARRLAAAGVPLTVLYKPPKRAAVRRMVEAARAASGYAAAPASAAGVRSLLRALRRGEAIGMLPDQVPTAGDGVWAPFFGRPAYTMTLPQRLAEATGAPLVMALGERLPAARGWRVHLEPLRGGSSPAELNAALERLIRRFPDQYVWGYSRYRAPPGVAPPGIDAVPSAPAPREPHG